MSEKKQVYIAAGIVRNSQNQIFIAERPKSSHMGGFWEFPGGKLEVGESPEQALYRELQEEIGIEITECELFQIIEHELSDCVITLYFFMVEKWNNDPFGKEGQVSRWVDQKTLIAYEFPPANRSVVALLTK